MRVTSVLRGAKVKIAIPDYKMYKVGEHTPHLMKVQKALAEKGLKDPWLRNEVWRYDTNYMLLHPGHRWIWLFRGILPGIVLGYALAQFYRYKAKKWDIEAGRDPDNHH